MSTQTRFTYDKPRCSSHPISSMRVLFVTAMLLLPLGLGGCACTSELGIKLYPRQVTLKIGEAVTPVVALTTCGGRQQVADHFSWSPQDSSIALVNPNSGLITALAAGSTLIEVTGERHGFLGHVEITVTQ